MKDKQSSRRVLTLEIIELGGGELAIRRPGSDTAPMVTVAFSDEFKTQLEDGYLEIGRAMLTAAVQMAAEAGHDFGLPEAQVAPTLH